MPSSTHPAAARDDSILGNPSSKVWRLNDQTGRTIDVEPTPRLYADESVPLLKAAEAGLGITRLPEHIAAAALASGRLVRVLPDWSAGVVMTTILTPHKRGQLPAVRAVIDFLAERDAASDHPAAQAPA